MHSSSTAWRRETGWTPALLQWVWRVQLKVLEKEAFDTAHWLLTLPGPAQAR
jgi:hypothetical protein